MVGRFQCLHPITHPRKGIGLKRLSKDLSIFGEHLPALRDGIAKATIRRTSVFGSGNPLLLERGHLLVKGVGLVPGTRRLEILRPARQQTQQQYSFSLAVFGLVDQTAQDQRNFKSSSASTRAEK